MSVARYLAFACLGAWVLLPGPGLAQQGRSRRHTDVAGTEQPSTGTASTGTASTGTASTGTASTGTASTGAASTEATGVAEERRCAEGRVRTSGRCCWPEQRWSDELGRCFGAPACPDPLVEHGDACMLPELEEEELFEEPGDEPPAEQLPPPTSAPSRARGYPIFTPEGYGSGRPRGFGESTAAWPARLGSPDAPRARAVIGTGEDEGLITAALVVFDIGWILGWLGTWIDEGQGGGCREFGGGFGPGTRVSCEGWGWSFVPIVGALASGLTTRAGTFHDSGWGIGFGMTSIIVQGIGGIMAIIAFANETTEIGFQPLTGATGLSARLVPGAAGADAGLSLDVTF